MLVLAPAQIRSIILAIEPELSRFAEQYDERKYPPAELKRLREAFAHPGSLGVTDVLDALVWKYGHTGKENYPGQQRALGVRIAEAWPENAIRSSEDPEDAFRRWRKLIGPTSFITVCFLLHLVRPTELPILDQHNYRAVTRHLADAGLPLVAKAKPSRFDDLLLVMDFTNAVLGGWQECARSATPGPDTLDRYLMMKGKAIKPHRNSRRSGV